MTTDTFALDDCFAMLMEDMDFIGDIVQPDVPVVTYRLSRNDAVNKLSPGKLASRGWRAMQALGLTHIRREGCQLRGDTTTGQRVKMTVIHGIDGTMYLLVTAGMPGTRCEAKEINRKMAALIERPSQSQSRRPARTIPVENWDTMYASQV